MVDYRVEMMREGASGINRQVIGSEMKETVNQAQHDIVPHCHLLSGNWFFLQKMQVTYTVKAYIGWRSHSDREVSLNMCSIWGIGISITVRMSKKIHKGPFCAFFFVITLFIWHTHRHTYNGQNSIQLLWFL